MFFEGFSRDLRFALRQLVRNPSFSVIAILVLAIGIGANTAVFSMVNSVLLRPLPYPEAGQLVMVRDTQQGSSPSGPMSYPEFAAWRTQTGVFDEVAAYATSRSILTELGEPEQLTSLIASANLLTLTGTTPALGRNFLKGEDTRESTPVVMVSYSFWQSHFNLDPKILDRTLRLSDRIYTIVGVLPEGFNFANNTPDVLIPLRLNAQIAPAGLKFLNVVGKLHSGVTASTAGAAINAAIPQVQKLSSDIEGAAVIPLKMYLTGDSRALLWQLLGAVAFVLLIACANIANLLIARAASREKEMAIRVSLGAERGRLLRQLLLESTFLAVIGGVLGLVLASVCEKLMSSFLANRLPRASEIHVDIYVLSFTALVSVGAGIIFGLAPALHALRGNLQQQLKQSGRQSTSTHSSQRLRQSLVVLEMAFSLVLLVGAGLLIHSFTRLLVSDKGFEPDHVLTMTVQPSGAQYVDPAKEISYLQEILRQTRSLPSIQSAGFVTSLPLLGNDIVGDVNIQGRPVDPKAPVIATKQFTSGDYFQTMRIPLVKGRYLGDADTMDSPRVAVINQEFANRYFPGKDPIGNHIDVSWGNPGWSEIVGVVSNTKQGNLALAAEPTLYVPVSQKPELLRMLAFSLTVRTGMEPSQIARSIVNKIHELDSKQAVSKVLPMEQILNESLAARRVSMWVLGVFSVIGLLLAAIGIYGVLSYYVAQRRQDIGVRIALGARRSQVLRLILGHAGTLIITGVVAGLIISFLLSRLMTKFLFSVRATDPITFIGVSVILTLLALLACSIPAFRATRVDPIVELRNE